MSKSSEVEWIEWTESVPPDLQKKVIRMFCQQYFYFSTRQVIAFSGIFRVISPLNREALAELADVLHEELGRGKLERVHSRLLERFAKGVGLSLSDLAIEKNQILPGVQGYIEELTSAFTRSLPSALAGYVFLETSAVETYGPMTELFRRCGFNEDELEFFRLHATVEVGHAETASSLMKSHHFNQHEQEEAEEQTRRLSKCWAAFWGDILKASKALQESH